MSELVEKVPTVSSSGAMNGYLFLRKVASILC